MSGEWCLIESDPGVFSALIRDFGVTGVQVEEIFSLDDDNFTNLQPIHGLVFLFKCIEDTDPEGSVVQDRRLDEIFFAKQVITNACATQAIVNILLNVEHGDVKLGSALSDFKDFTQAFDCMNKGLALTNSDLIRTVHNGFSRQQIFEYDNTMTKKDQDSYHFIGYVPIKGRLYELDGIKAGPVDLGAIDGEDWLPLARSVIQKRIGKYKETEIHFNLMAVVSDRKIVLERQIEQLQSSMETDFVSDKIARLQSLLEVEDEKRRNYRLENIRRKHNYLPFIVELIKILAAENKLVSLVQDEKKKLQKKREQDKSKEKSEVKSVK